MFRISFSNLCVQVRYNFVDQRGEIRVDKEYRQRCPIHGGELVTPLIYDSAALYIMHKLQKFIFKKFYSDERDSDTRTRHSSLGSSSQSSYDGSYCQQCSFQSPGLSPFLQNMSPDHWYHNCEACVVGRCPLPAKRIIPDFNNYIPGTMTNRKKKLEFINWVILDYENKPQYVVL